MEIRRIKTTDGPALKLIRQHSLVSDDTSFGIHHDQLAELSDSDWTDVCRTNAGGSANTIVVAVVAGGLIGMVGCRQDRSPKLQHCGMVWGMYVLPAYRGQHIGHKLLSAVIQYGAKIGYMMLKLSVMERSARALALYTKAGFTTYAHEPALFCIDGITYDACHMMYLYPRK